MTRAPRIPAREPIGDTFTGVVLQVDEQYVLASAPIPNTTLVHEGECMVRYGVVYLMKPNLSIVPALLALDYGEVLAGEDAWDFLLNRSNLYPRADVVGYRNDGEDDMIVVKFLDLEHPYDVLVYANADDTTPMAQVNAIITDDSSVIADRIRQNLPIYPSLAEWRNQS